MPTMTSSDPVAAISQLSLYHINDETPMGGNLLPSGYGATFKVWAPAARQLDLF